jgi:hypothetical protein
MPTPGNSSLVVGAALPTYSAGFQALALAATATDAVTITGANGKIVYVTSITLSGAATAAGAVGISVIKRTTANTGGTSTAPAGVARDIGGNSLSPVNPASAIVQGYTVNPASLGTAAPPTGGTLLNEIIPIGTAAAPSAPTVIDFIQDLMAPVVLRSASDVLALNFNGVTVTGGIVACTVTWLEG